MADDDSEGCEFSSVIVASNVGRLEFIRCCVNGSSCGKAAWSDPEVFVRCPFYLREKREPTPQIDRSVVVRKREDDSGDKTAYYGSECGVCGRKGSSYCRTQCSLRSKV